MAAFHGPGSHQSRRLQLRSPLQIRLRFDLLVTVLAIPAAKKSFVSLKKGLTVTGHGAYCSHSVQSPSMRKINTRDFRVATRSTSRDINRRIALNVIHEHQPISRAELARRMKVTRGVAGVLVQELLDQDLIYEGATGEAAFGRKPTLLHIKSHDRLVVAVDIRFSKTYVMVCDFSGRQLALETCDTIFSIPELIRDLGERIRRLIKTTGITAGVEGVGVAVPGMVDQRSGRILNAPALGWRDVELRNPLATATGLPVEIENSGRACTLALLWLERGESLRPQNFVYVGVSDGVGV